MRLSPLFFTTRMVVYLMIKRQLCIIFCLLLLLPLCAQAGGKTAGKDGHLVPQEGAYEPRYTVSGTYKVLPAEPFEVVLYEDSGTLPLVVARNGGSMPAGAGLLSRTTADGTRQAYVTGLSYGEGDFTFSVLVQESAGDPEAPEALRTLAILHVKLRVTSDIEVVEPYLGDGVGMLRLAIDGVNFRRTAGGTRLGQYDEGTRLVYTGTDKSDGYLWYRVWSADYGYGYVRADLVQLEPPLRLVYTPGKETAFPIFITAGNDAPLTPSLIMTESPEVIGFDTQPLVTVQRGSDTWTLLCFTIPEDAEKSAFFIQVDLREADGTPLECQVIYLTPRWEEVPPYTEN